MRLHGADYIALFGKSVPHGHLRAMGAIAQCRMPALGGELDSCAHCWQQHLLFHAR